MTLDNKGLASAELIFVTLLFLIIAASFLNLANSEMDITQTGDLGKVRLVGEKIAETVNTVYINGNGYSANLTLSATPNYKAYVNNTGFINMEYNNKNVTIKILPANKVQTVTMTQNQRYIVKNNNGTINFILV